MATTTNHGRRASVARGAAAHIGPERRHAADPHDAADRGHARAAAAADGAAPCRGVEQAFEDRDGNVVLLYGFPPR